MPHSSPSSLLPTIEARRIVAVLRAPSPQQAVEATGALVESGITVIEITFTTPDAASAISRAIERYGDRAVVGAGTLVSETQAHQARDAGAHFLVSPGSDDALTPILTGTGLLTMTGAITPTEVMKADALGSDVIKLFPGSLVGPSYIGALKGPFPHLKFMPTGGVNPGNLGEWLSQGAIAVGAGGDLIPSQAIAIGDFDEIGRRARLFVDALDAYNKEVDSQ